VPQPHIAEFQGIQFMFADMAMTLEAARQMVDVAATKSERSTTACRSSGLSSSATP